MSLRTERSEVKQSQSLRLLCCARNDECKAIIIAGKDGSDAKSYLEKQVNEALEQLKTIEVEPEETEE